MTINTKDLHKIEFLTVSILYGLSLLMLIAGGSNENSYQPYKFKELGISYSYLSNYFIPELFQYSMQYFSFLVLNFCCLPALIQKKNIGLHLSIISIIYILCGLVISISNTYIQADKLLDYNNIVQAYNHIFFDGFTRAASILALISIYYLLKTTFNHLLNNKEKDSNSQMKLELALGAALWFVGIVILSAIGNGIWAIICWTLIIIPCILLTIYSIYFLIPTLISQHKSFWIYLVKILLISILITLLLGLIILIIGQNGNMFGVIAAFHIPAQLFIGLPLAWYIYKARNSTAEQITSLKMELGKSDANLGFLKSQINPHFLFNALNTLYGTALQENAERTGEGIQKLGDMMRFMLQENMQDKISLSRDIDYLNNYIALQKLRTSVSVDIVIHTEIEEQLSTLEITPMLLIPFVENAFKHGISLQSPSHIKITLQTKGKTLYFDVHNSIHIKPDGDPEKLNSGIGLENVKQRLHLLYPKRHELIIRESAKEFFVHLTLNLD